jgi:hypothetical protein
MAGKKKASRSVLSSMLNFSNEIDQYFHHRLVAFFSCANGAMTEVVGSSRQAPWSF